MRAAAKRQAAPCVRAWTECLEGDIESARAETAGARAADTLAARRRQRVLIAETPEVQPIEPVESDDDSGGASSGDEGLASHGNSCGGGWGSATHGESCGGASGAAGSSDAAPNWEATQWAAWHDKHRWRWVNGQWFWRPVGQGPDGGSDCPPAHPARAARNKARKAKKELKRAERREREAQDPDAASADAWNRVYERQVNQRVHELRQAPWRQGWS